MKHIDTNLTEKILRNAEALANTVPDETVQGLIRQAYIKGAKDNAVDDMEITMKEIIEKAKRVRLSCDSEKHLTFVNEVAELPVEDNTVNVEMVTDSKTVEQTKTDTEFKEVVYEILAEAVKRQGLDSDFYKESCDRLLKLAKTCISLQSTQETDVKP